MHRGGTQVTVYGSHLNSVAQPRITVTLVITGVIERSLRLPSTTDTNTGVIERSLHLHIIHHIHNVTQ